MLDVLFPVIQGFLAFIAICVIILMIVRLIYNFTDPNPFGAVGRFGYNLKKFTEKIVYPSAGILRQMRINTKYAPVLTIIGTIVICFFILQLFHTIFFTIDGISANLIGGSVIKIVGFLLYGLLGLLSLAIVIRIILSWVVPLTNPALTFLRKMTDPILEPFRRIIPSLGAIDISPIVVLLLIGFLQTAVMGVLIGS